MTSILADTSVLIEAQRDSLLLEELVKNQSQLVISRVTANELTYGSRSKKELKENQSLVATLPILEINEPISMLSYTLISLYCLKNNLGVLDALIAATAITHKLPLWTLNTKHFATIRGLKIFSL